MRTKRFLDTNVLIYAFDSESPKSVVAEQTLASGGSIGVQNLNEFVNVSRRKLRLEWKEVEARLAVVTDLVDDVVPLSLDVHERALDLARRDGLAFYDALIVAAALVSGCSSLITEDLQHGRTIAGMRIIDPFV